MKDTYVHASAPFILDGSDQYVIPMVKDAPSELTPAEKIVKHGPDTLTAAELFSLIITPDADSNETATEVAARIMKEYGDKGALSSTNVRKVSEDLSIPLSQAIQVAACAELGRRFYKKNDMAVPAIRSARDVFAYAADIRELPKEHLRGIYLNTHYKVIHDEVISIGTVDTSIIHPREVFKPALEYSAAAVVLVHNHPSGEAKPSDADVAVTKQLVEAGKLLGIELIDHVIVTKEEFTSIKTDYS